MNKNNIKNIFIVLIGTFILNLVFYFLNIKLGYENIFVFFAIITVYSLLTMYNLFFGNIQIFNKIYKFTIGILALFSVFRLDYRIRISKDSLKEVRTLDIYNSKIIYLIGNITMLILLYFVYTCFVGESPSFIFLILFVLGLIFPIFYVPLYESLTLNFSKTDLVKLILMIILLVITSIFLFVLKINAIIVLVYFSLLVSLILTFDNKKMFITNLILLIIFILVPIFVFLWLF